MRKSVEQSSSQDIFSVFSEDWENPVYADFLSSAFTAHTAFSKTKDPSSVYLEFAEMIAEYGCLCPFAKKKFSPLYEAMLIQWRVVYASRADEFHNLCTDMQTDINLVPQVEKCCMQLILSLVTYNDAFDFEHSVRIYKAATRAAVSLCEKYDANNSSCAVLLIILCARLAGRILNLPNHAAYSLLKSAADIYINYPSDDPINEEEVYRLIVTSALHDTLLLSDSERDTGLMFDEILATAKKLVVDLTNEDAFVLKLDLLIYEGMHAEDTGDICRALWAYSEAYQLGKDSPEMVEEGLLETLRMRISDISGYVPRKDMLN